MRSVPDLTNPRTIPRKPKPRPTMSDKKPSKRIIAKSQGKKYHRPGKLALKEIRKYQKSTELLIPQLSFSRLVREVMAEISRSKIGRIEKNALMALHESAEFYLTSLFQDAQLEAVHGNRITVLPKDMRIARRIRGEIQ